MAQKGVNLGGWLVLEKWITPSLFAGSKVIDEYSLSQEGKAMQEKIHNHHQTFITEADIIWMKDKGVEIIRVPVGYWILGNQPPYIGAIDQLDWLFRMAKKHGIKIILSIHGAPSSQNGKIHSGRAGEVDWIKYRHDLALFTMNITKRYAHEKSFWGIGLLNEPHINLKNSYYLIGHYRKMSRQIKVVAPSLNIIIDDGFTPLIWAWVARHNHAILDCHLYHGFHGANYPKSIKNLSIFARKLKIIRKIAPVMIGEWSGVISQSSTKSQTKAYVQQQISTYDPVSAWCYWTYKTEGGGSWSFRDQVNQQSIRLKKRA